MVKTMESMASMMQALVTAATPTSSPTVGEGQATFVKGGVTPLTPVTQAAEDTSGPPYWFR